MKLQIHTHGRSAGRRGWLAAALRVGSKILPVARLLPLCLVLCPALGLAASARGAPAEDAGPWMQALQEAFVVLDLTQGDLDGDGKDETAVCYQDTRLPGYSGLAVLKWVEGQQRPVFHAFLELRCEKLKIAGGKIGMKQEDGARGPKQLVWRYGDQIVFLSDARHPLRGIEATSSTELRGEGPHLPSATLDRNLATSWAEGASGTGIGETLTFKLPRKMRIAYVGVFGGHGGGERAYYDHNRVHRASLKAQTAEDLGDDDSGIDFGSLGLEIGGERVEFSLENQPTLKYVRVDKRDVMQLELRVDSVYLGRRRDDTHIAEVEIVPLLPYDELVVSEQPPLARNDAGPKKPEPAPSGGGRAASDADGDDPAPRKGRDEKDVLKELDEGGRSIVSDDF